MTFVRRILTLGATTLAAAALASPALAGEGAGEAGPSTGTTTSSPTTYCRDSARYQGEGEVVRSAEQPPGDWHECEEGEVAGYEAAREKRYAEEDAALEAQNKKVQAAIGRERAEADNLEEQSRLCDKQPSACSPHSSVRSSVASSKAAPPKPVSHLATRQASVSRYGNPAGVEVRPVEQPQDEGLEDAIDVPETHGFSLIDPALRAGPRNLVWFSVVAMAAISSLGYGLWRILFVGDV